MYSIFFELIIDIKTEKTLLYILSIDIIRFFDYIMYEHSTKIQIFNLQKRISLVCLFLLDYACYDI